MLLLFCFIYDFVYLKKNRFKVDVMIYIKILYNYYFLNELK